MEKLNYLKSINADYIDDLFTQYSADPDSVDASWRYFFEGLELGSTNGASVTPSPPASNGHANGSASSNGTVSTLSPSATTSTGPVGVDLVGEARVAELIRAYREFGRALADINPLSPPPSSHPALELARFELSNADLAKTFQAGKLLGMGAAKLSDILTALKETYCNTIATELAQVADPAERDWLQRRLESTRGREKLDADTRKLILQRLSQAETFERFLHTRYVAQKRFSVEGGESIIPSLDCIIEVAGESGARDIVLGMAHRGRLNVLANVFGKKAEYIMTQFEGTYKVDTSKGEGDVKYHMGYSADVVTRTGKKLHLSMAFNPSHLEVIDPVVEGMARAKQTYLGDRERLRVIPILIHGDASFAGQGVVYETLNLSRLNGYATGGTIHIVINNQIGFTASAEESRSTPYCTDLAKMLETPIFHVNGDDPEAVWTVSKIAIEYRQKFKKDVFIDLVCYRKHGHNEGDEPSFTQPLMYKKIKAHASTRELYAGRLATAGVVTAEQAKAIVDELNAKLTEAQAKTRAESPTPMVSAFEGRWSSLRRPTEEDLFKPVATAVPEPILLDLATRINRMPEGFNLHPKLARFFEARLHAVKEGKGIDWGGGEALAYASLLNEGTPVRLSGQDAERGTFTHRHSVLNDFETGDAYIPFNHLRDNQTALFEVYNSHLSEVGVMGFELGYSFADPNTLVIWEAQFGDFANGAQVIIDQFLAAAESKWQRSSGLTLLLPHGYEGQAAEHSSARLERFLQLCGRANLCVVNLTTPVQLFHALRRQMKRDFRKPLIVMSPKSLLRHPMAVSTLAEFGKGGFQEVIDDAQFNTPGSTSDAAGVKKVILCSGKVYYDLLAHRTESARSDVAIVRLEQFYPWPAARLESILKRYPKAKSIVWAQEEPRNMGAWGYVFGQWEGGLGLFRERAGDRTVSYVGREVAAAAAVGSAKVSEKEQKTLVEKAIDE